MLERQLIEALRRYLDATVRASLADSEDEGHYRAEALHARLTYKNLVEAYHLRLGGSDASVQSASDRLDRTNDDDTGR